MLLFVCGCRYDEYYYFGNATRQRMLKSKTYSRSLYIPRVIPSNIMSWLNLNSRNNTRPHLLAYSKCMYCMHGVCCMCDPLYMESIIQQKMECMKTKNKNKKKPEASRYRQNSYFPQKIAKPANNINANMINKCTTTTSENREHTCASNAQTKQFYTVTLHLPHANFRGFPNFLETVVDLGMWGLFMTKRNRREEAKERRKR